MYAASKSAHYDCSVFEAADCVVSHLVIRFEAFCLDHLAECAAPVRNLTADRRPGKALPIWLAVRGDRGGRRTTAALSRIAPAGDRRGRCGRRSEFIEGQLYPILLAAGDP